jgi:hypothetical protein
MASVEDNKFTLPSQGAFYDAKIPGGVITLRSLTAYELSVLFASGQLQDRINKIIDTVAELPNGFKHKDLLVTDRLAVLLGVRILSYGPKYAFNYTCEACKKSVKHECDVLEDLERKPVEEGASDPFTIKLPKCGKEVTLRFMRGTDEEAMMKYTKRISGSASNDPSDPSNLHRQARLLVAIDGQPAGDMVIREKFCRELSAMDSIVIDNELSAREPGINLDVHAECPACGFGNEMKLPFTLEFFRPSSLRA